MKSIKIGRVCLVAGSVAVVVGALGADLSAAVTLGASEGQSVGVVESSESTVTPMSDTRVAAIGGGRGRGR